MGPEVKAARERMASIAHADLPALGGPDNRADARLILAALDEAEARAEVLAAECRAWRAWDWSGPLDEPERLEHEHALENTRSSTDAAGALEGK